MSLVDSIFSSIPGPLITQFGIDAIYLKASQNQTYNPNTGTVSGAVTEIPVRIVICELKPEEISGLDQAVDVKFLISADSLSGYYPQTTDSIRFTQANRVRTAKIIGDPSNARGNFSYRGDNPILHVIFARFS